MEPKTLGDLLLQLRTIMREHPEAVNYPVITAIDDEGNGYNKVYYDACIVHFSNNDIKEPDENKEANAICLN